jgi:hypothetical protein
MDSVNLPVHHFSLVTESWFASDHNSSFSTLRPVYSHKFVCPIVFNRTRLDLSFV